MSTHASSWLFSAGLGLIEVADDKILAKVAKHATEDPQWAQAWAMLQIVRRLDALGERLVTIEDHGVALAGCLDHRLEELAEAVRALKP